MSALQLWVSQPRWRREGEMGPGGAGLHRRCGSASIRDRGTVSIVGAGNGLLESVVTSCWIGWKRVLEYSVSPYLPGWLEEFREAWPLIG